jgi:acyl dehydratase
MGPAAVSYQFKTLPSSFRYFPRAVFGRRSALVPDGQAVPRLEAGVERVRARAAHLARYCRVCGFDEAGTLPIAYPHVLAMPLHVALLTHPRFLVRLMGLVHIGNEIQQFRELPADASYRLRTWVEGHRDGDRGHEFDLFTELDDDAGTAWREKSTLLARRPGRSAQAARSARQTLRYEKPAESDVPQTVDVAVPRAVGRRYGWLSGDLNPIHLGDRGARLFGFDRAVAHGMWSMARTFAALGDRALEPPVRAHVDFKFPLFMPAVAQLQHWQHDGRRVFVLKDAETGRPHLAGSTHAG